MRLTERDPQAPPTIRPVARAETLGSFFWLIMLLMWWQGINPVVWRGFGLDPFPFSAAPVWERVTPLVMLCIGGGLVRSVVALALPRAVRFHAAAGLLLNVLALRVLVTLFDAGEWVIVDPNHPTAVFNWWINGSVSILLLVVAIVFVVSAAFDSSRLGAMTGATTEQRA